MATTNASSLALWISQFKAQLNVISDFVTKFPVSDGTRAIFYMDDNLLSKYTEELDAFKVKVELTPREQQFYAYNPRLFSYDMYGYPEFWYLILYANELHSATDFALDTVKFYNAGVLDVLNTIRQLEIERMDANSQEVTDIIRNNTVVNADILTSIV